MAHEMKETTVLARGTEPSCPKFEILYTEQKPREGAPLWPGVLDRMLPTGKISENRKKSSQHGPLGPNPEGQNPSKSRLNATKEKSPRI